MDPRHGQWPLPRMEEKEEEEEENKQDHQLPILEGYQNYPCYTFNETMVSGPNPSIVFGSPSHGHMNPPPPHPHPHGVSTPTHESSETQREQGNTCRWCNFIFVLDTYIQVIYMISFPIWGWR